MDQAGERSSRRVFPWESLHTRPSLSLSSSAFFQTGSDLSLASLDTPHPPGSEVFSHVEIPSVKVPPHTSTLDERDQSLPRTSLTSLPTEIISQIAWALAPDGGAKASSLRLVSRHLASIVTPVVSAAVKVPQNFDKQLELMATLRKPHNSLRQRIRSLHIIVESPVIHRSGPHYCTLPLAAWSPLIPSLTVLSRLHLSGLRSESLKLTRPKLQDAQIISTTLRHLHLENLDLKNNLALSQWASIIDHLTVTACRGSSWLFVRRVPGHTGGGDLVATPIAHLELSTATVATSNRDALVSISSCLPTTTHIKVTLEILEPVSQDPLRFAVFNTAPLRSFHLVGPKDLFTAAGTLTSAPTLIKLLNLLGQSNLAELSLPFEGDIAIPLIYSTLRLPTLQRLLLTREPVIILEEPPGYWADPAFSHLPALLTPTTFPSLTYLHLSGFVTDRRFLAAADRGLDVPALLKTTKIARVDVRDLQEGKEMRFFKVVEEREGEEKEEEGEEEKAVWTSAGMLFI